MGEKISNIIKQFKLSCGKVRTGFRSFHVKNSLFSATIEQFLQHSFVMVVVSDQNIQSAATMANLWAARRHSVLFQRVMLSLVLICNAEVGIKFLARFWHW